MLEPATEENRPYCTLETGDWRESVAKQVSPRFEKFRFGFRFPFSAKLVTGTFQRKGTTESGFRGLISLPPRFAEP